MAMLGIFGTELFGQIILSFALIFTIIFAILERSKILGEDKHQINSIVSLVVALIGTPFARTIIAQVVPVAVILIIIILSFMLILGFAGATTKEGYLNTWLKVAVGIIAAIVLVVTVLWSTGWLAKLIEVIKQPGASVFWQSLLLVVVIAVVMLVAIKSTGKKEE
jgi:hypothetical protein